MSRRILGAALFACSVLASSQARAEKTLTVAASVFVDSLMTGISSYASLSLLLQTYDPLLSRDNAGALHPDLATSWEQVNDTTMRFHLRHGVKWHDGEPFTADDVAFTINRIVDPKQAYGMLARIAQVSGAEVIDPDTVDIKTKAVFPTLLKGLSDVIIEPKHYFEKVGAKGEAAHPIGTGPFVFSKWIPGDRYELTANKDYWDGAPKVDRLVIREIPDAATRVASLVAGETQIIEEVPIDLIPQVQQSGIAKIDEVPTTVGLVLTYDTRVPPFNNPKVREAFDYAVDKPTILKEILKGHGELLRGQLFTAATFGFNADLTPRPYDPDKAKKMLQDAGYDFKTPIPIATQSGKYVSDVDIANAVAGMLSQIGVNATVNTVEGGVYNQMFNALKMGPMYMVGWYSLGDADFAAGWFTKGGYRTTWVNDEYEKLFLAARSTNDQAERLRDYKRMTEIMYAENPTMFLFGLPSIYGVNKKVTNFGAAPDKLWRLTKTDIQ